MKTNNFVSRFIVVTLTAALLLMSGSRAIPVSALAVGPISEPVYETEIIQLKEYIESGSLTPSQLPIFYFLLGSLAVAQLGSQDAMLNSPYPIATDIHEWFVNLGINLYNSLIVLVPEGNYYVGDIQGTYIPRSTIKALVAAAMGDAVVAANYPDLQTFLDDNPDHIFVNLNKDLQLGVNAIFGLNGGIDDWQTTRNSFSDFTWNYRAYSSSVLESEYASYFSTYIQYGTPLRINNSSTYAYNYQIFSDVIADHHNLFIDNVNYTVTLRDDSGNTFSNNSYTFYFLGYDYFPGSDYITHTFYNYNFYKSYSYNPSQFNTYNELITYVLHNILSVINLPFTSTKEIDFPDLHVYLGSDWNNKIELFNDTTLNIESYLDYYQQVTNDYLLDIRGLISDLVNYVYVRQPVFDNIYDLEGNNVVPILVQISTQLENLTYLVAPPVPVNMNDIAEYTDNTYLERVKEHARNAGDIFANYVAFWHNCDSDLVYTVFGAAILVLVGAFVGKWGHS